ncbi:MAG: hypothetical protein R3E42_09505 [Burkholderiaceae bacterium]
MTLPFSTPESHAAVPAFHGGRARLWACPHQHGLEHGGGVFLHLLRHRLTVAEALAFAAILPPMLRALFIEDWDCCAAACAVGDPQEWLADVRSVHEAALP